MNVLGKHNKLISYWTIFMLANAQTNYTVSYVCMTIGNSYQHDLVDYG